MINFRLKLNETMPCKLGVSRNMNVTKHSLIVTRQKCRHIF